MFGRKKKASSILKEVLQGCSPQWFGGYYEVVEAIKLLDPLYKPLIKEKDWLEHQEKEKKRLSQCNCPACERERRED